MTERERKKQMIIKEALKTWESIRCDCLRERFENDLDPSLTRYEARELVAAKLGYDADLIPVEIFPPVTSWYPTYYI